MLVVIKLVYICSGWFDVWDDYDGESFSWYGFLRESWKLDEICKERED